MSKLPPGYDEFKGMTLEEYQTICSDLADKYFPKGKCKERGNLLVFIAELWIQLEKSSKTSSSL